MNTSRHQPGIQITLLVGVVYFLIGTLFALPIDHVQTWRLAAWLIGAMMYAAHIGYEYFRLSNSPRSIAIHAAIAVAIGAFGLAVAATIHFWLIPSNNQLGQFLLALVLWPAIAAVPAFLVALVAVAVLMKIRPRA